jgi:hypothetical protein
MDRQHFRDIEALLRISQHGTQAEQLEAFHRLVEALSWLRRVDVTFHEAGCDCCSGDYERSEVLFGEYVVADRITEVLARAVKRPIQPGELSLKP